ncbi:MarR family winged helix-turn-helix transcriptional regulator [Govanella unica]|uniref:MarR family transcriptional regulator n=1 Tax=Govanella unica TaxID=2975056 RepID=A0A9X3TY83_9PROT|nr:MarR family transcriptional regulator [Govania unica]MDA5193963.1 MarR family transcriptional regulator [Govania unica]
MPKTIARHEMHTPFLAPDEPGFALDDFPLYNLNRASWTYIDEMTRVLKSVDVDHPTWRVLLLLGDKNPSSVTSLSQRSVTKMSTITRILIRMEESGLVRRIPSPADSRVTEVFLTEAGQEVMQKLQVIGGHMYRKAFAGFSHDEITMLVTLLQRLRNNLTRSPYLGNDGS